MKGLLAYVGLLLAFSAGSAAAQNTYTAYINSDNSAASGCTITLPGGTFIGADWRVQATLTPGATPTVTSVTLTPCSGGTFGAGTSIGGGSVDFNTGVSGSDSVEFSAPGTGILSGGTQTLAFGFTAQSPTGSDVMFTTNGGPIIFGITVPAPALGAGALVLLALLIMGVAGRFGRTRWYRHMAALSLVAMCGVALAAAFNWTGIPPIATDPSGDPTNGSPDIDLRAGFVAVSSGTLYIRIDVADLQTQAPQITSANATTFIVGQAGTFTATSTGVPSAALALSGCTLPAGVTFVDNGNGTATLAGTPGPGTANTYACTLTASNGIPPNATQAFTLTVANAPSQTALVADINPSVFAQTVTFTATVTPAPPGSGAPTGAVNFLDGATNIGSGTLNGSGVATFATAALSVATHPITAQYAGDVNFGPSTSSVVNQVVNQASQTITFTSTAPAGAAVGGATYTVTATASSGLAVALTVDASAASVCSLAGSTVSFIGVGNCVIDANQAGDANYTAAPQVQQSFAVGKGSQTITFTSTAPAGAAVGGSTYTVTATASSGLTVALAVDASSASVCSLAGSTVSFIGAGNCVIDANQAGNANYNAAPQAQQSFAVGKGSQTITFTSTAPANAVVAGPTYTVTATASSGLPVTFTIDATATSVCSIAGSTVSFTAAGTCVIDANQAGDANWNAAPQAAQSFAVSKNNQTITFSSTAPVGAVVAGPTYTVTATATPSGLPVAFTIDATASSVCSIAGSTVSFIGAGTCVIDANQAGDANYNAAPQVQQSFAVGKGSQTISFTTTAPVGAAVGGPTYTVAATATSGLPVTLSIDASSSSVCSIAGSTVSFIGAGSCVIDANQAGNANYNAAPQAQQAFAVAKGNQTISFTSTAPAAAQFNGSPYTVTATATSGLAVTFTIDASATSVCSITGSTVSFIGAGTCVIDANQAGDANWNAAPQVQQSFAVAKADQTISYTSTPPVNALVGGATYTVAATATSGLAVTFSIDASAASVCSIAGSTVSFIGGGTCLIDANQSGNANYNAAPQAQQSFLVNKNDQTITFTSTAPANAKNAGPTYTVTATASSGLTVALTIDASSASVCSIAGSTVSFIGAGTCVIDANQAGNAAYNAAPQVQQSFLVAKGDQTINATSTAPAFGSATAAGTPHTYTVVATATSGLTVSVSTSGACSNAGTLVTFGPAAGTCTIMLDQAGDTNWNAAPQVQQSTTVEIPASAVNDSHAVTGNVAIAAGTSVLGNDSGTNIAILSYGATGTEQTSIGTATATAQGGSVTLVAAGTYNYDPPPNFTGTDTFAYIIGNDLSTTSTGTVTLTVSDRIIVVASGASGNCKPVTPTPCALSFADGLAAPTGKDLVFVESGSYANPNAAITLNANQALVGNGNTANTASLAQAITDAGITLASESVALATINSATAPSLSNNASVITLGGGNLVEYFAITNTAGAAIAGTSAGSGTSNIHDIAVTDSGNAGNGVNLTANLGTLNFSNLTIATSSGSAFAASGGGTVNVTAGSIPNTLASTAGTALNVSNTTIGASGMTFRSISAGSTSGSAGNGIILDTTGASGGLTVTGNGAAGTGGTIQHKTGADLDRNNGIGIYLNNTKNVSLNFMQLNDFQNFAIRGFTVNGFALTNSVVNGTNGTNTANNGADDAGEGSIYFGNATTNGLSGAVAFTTDSVSGGAARNVSNTTTSGTATITTTGTTFGLNQNVSGANQSLFVEARNNGTIVNSTVTGSTFTGAPGDLANFTGQIGSTMDVQFKNNTLSNSHPGNIIGGGGLTLATEGIMTFVVDNNTMRGADGSAVTFQKATTGVPATDALTSLTGKFTNNIVGVAGVVDSASKSGNGLFLSAAGAGTIGLTITGNDIRNWHNNGGMFFDNTGGSYTANFTIQSNTVAEPGTGSFTDLAITNGGNLSTDTVNVCAAIGGAGALQNSFQGATGLADIFLGSSGNNGGHTFNLPGYAGASNLANVQTFVTNNNTLTGTLTVQAYDDNGGQGAFTGAGTSCPTP